LLPLTRNCEEEKPKSKKLTENVGKTTGTLRAVREKREEEKNKGKKKAKEKRAKRR